MKISNCMRVPLTAIGIGVAGLASFATASAATLNDIVSRGTVRIGVLTGAPPMGMVDENGNPSGYDVDVANLIAGYLSLPVELVPLTPPARIPALQTGKVDFLVATLAPTGERAKTVMFTQPYSAFNMDIISGPDQKFASLPNLKASVWRSIAARRRKRHCARRQCQAGNRRLQGQFHQRAGTHRRSGRCGCAAFHSRRSDHQAASGRRPAGWLHLLPAGQLDGDETGRFRMRQWLNTADIPDENLRRSRQDRDKMDRPSDADASILLIEIAQSLPATALAGSKLRRSSLMSYTFQFGVLAQYQDEILSGIWLTIKLSVAFDHLGSAAGVPLPPFAPSGAVPRGCLSMPMSR